MEKKKAIWGFIFTIPAIVFFMIFDFYPVINAFWMSFFKKDLLSLKPPKFIGFKNYTYLFTSEAFWNSVKATAIFTLGTFIPMVLVSLVLAAMIMTRKRFQKFLQMAYYSPAVLSSVVAAMIWLLMFDPRGLANQFLNFLFSTQGIDYHWLSNENMLRLATIIVYFWKYVGYFTVIFVSGMASIPRSIHEAAYCRWGKWVARFLAYNLTFTKTNHIARLCDVDDSVFKNIQYAVSLRARRSAKRSDRCYNAQYI